MIDEHQVKLDGTKKSIISGVDIETGNDLALVNTGTHEGTHTKQKTFDIERKQKDPKTGKYKKTEQVKPYEERRYEIEGEKAGNAAESELKEKRKKKS